MTRNTTSGINFQRIVAECIKRSCEHYELDSQSEVNVGVRPSGGKHRVDFELWSRTDPNKRALVSCKYQETGGTAEEKIPYEVIKLIHTMESDRRYRRAWLVLGGVGFTPSLVDFYKTRLHEFIPSMRGRIDVLSTDELIAADLQLL